MTPTEPAQAWYFGDRFPDNLAHFTQDETLDAEALGVLAWIICQPPGTPLPWDVICDRFDITPKHLGRITNALKAASARLPAEPDQTGQPTG